MRHWRGFGAVIPMSIEEAFVPEVLFKSGGVRVELVRPAAMRRYVDGLAHGAAWQSLKDESWKAVRPDRDGGRIRIFGTQRLALLFLAAEVDSDD